MNIFEFEITGTVNGVEIKVPCVSIGDVMAYMESLQYAAMKRNAEVTLQVLSEGVKVGEMTYKKERH